MGFNGFICDNCGCLVDFSGSGEAGSCAACGQLDLNNDGCCYCLQCCLQMDRVAPFARCDQCSEFLCHDCYQGSHVCPDCE
uniref:Uncharacterized protein n=1 Tax=viral metagenome TaxID=1070528 RepID=A0A6C0BJP4_9ZZZZ